MSVFKKLLEVQAATRSLAPNAEGQTGAARYNYVAGSKVLDRIRPLMDKLGLLLFQEVIGITNEPITYTTRNGEKTEMFTSIHIRFTWVDTEDESRVENEFFANGMNAWDKGLGSALTYAERYYLMKTFHIATDDDDIDALKKEEAISITPSPAVAARRKAAGRDNAPAYTPMPEENYWRVVERYAKGQKAKNGGDYRSAWIELTHAGKAEIAKFDRDVEDYKSANL